MLDNQSDKVILVCYPMGAGGNFLINCLGLSDNCVFSHSDLAKKQLLGQFNFESKVDYLMSRLDQCQQKRHWDDLGRGFTELLGFPANNSVFSNVDFKHIVEKYIHPVMYEILRDRKYFFLQCHDTFSIRQYKIFWPNAKLIIFNNFSQFNKRRRLGNRPSHRLVSELWDADIDVVAQQIPDPFHWDCRWYDEEQLFLQNLDRCCDWLNMASIDHQAVKIYRKRWLEVVRITDPTQENYAVNQVI